MADALPKVKMWIFLSLFKLIINISVTLSSGKIDLLGIFSSIGGAFVPFVELIGVATSGLPIEVIAFIAVFTSIISAIQLYLIAVIIANFIPTVNV
jgi:hypothetical protein